MASADGFAAMFAARIVEAVKESGKVAKDENKMGYTQWSQSADGSAYIPVGNTVPVIEPGYYDIGIDNGTMFFRKIRARTDDLLVFPDSASRKVVDGITDFWEREKVFKQYKMPFKRGILLYGPPGSGKSCTLQLIARDVVERGGVVVAFNSVFLSCYRALRDIQPDIPIVVLMEDFETTLKNQESKVLNLLDGVEELDKVVFLATTNYPQMLEPRIINRPSRFDFVIKVPHPNIDSRKLYLYSLIDEKDEIDVEKYATDTEGMSLAHLKELFVATVILGLKYEDTLNRLKAMCQNKLSSFDTDDDFGSAGGMYI